MEDEYLKISMTKVFDIIIKEERDKIRKYYLDVLGKPTADLMDTYVPTESEFLKAIKS